MQISFMRHSIAERREMILNGNPFRSLIFLSLPTLLMAVVQSLIPLTDGLFLNQNASVAVASAVGFAVPVINILTALSQGLAVAAMSILGQYFGRGDFARVKQYASQTMFYSFLLGCCIAPLTALAAWILSKQVDPEIASHLFHYLGIYSLVLPFLFCASIYNAIKSSMGKPEANFIRMVLLFLLKLLFNSIFLYGLHLNEYGAVLASLCSYLCISAWMFYDLYVVPSESQLYFRNIRPDWDYLRTWIRLAIPSMISSVLVNLGFYLINTEVMVFGKTALNAQTIASNINAMAFAVPSSIGSTITMMVSMHVGVKNAKAAKGVFLRGILISLILSASLILFFVPFGPDLVRMFREDPEIVAIATRALNIYSWSIIGFGVFMVANGALIGLGRTKISMVSGILRIWFFRYVFIRLFVHQLGVDAVFWGNLVSNFICAFLFVSLLFFIPWRSVIESDLDKDKNGGSDSSAKPTAGTAHV